MAAASFLPALAAGRESTAAYPPALTGLRGSHAGSFEVAHALAREGRRDWGPVNIDDAGIHDLIVVGGGISGLAAAYFFRQRYPGSRVLILDNHDDFGGHAKRNEFEVDGRRIIGYGGSQTLENPSGYDRVTRKLLRDLAIDVDRFGAAYDQSFYRDQGLGGGVYFNREDWGVDRLVRFDLAQLSGYLPLADSGLSAPDAVQQMPLSDPARREILRLLRDDTDQLGSVTGGDREDYLYSISYREFLTRHIGIREPEVFRLLQNLTTDSCLGIEATSAGDAIFYAGLPGFSATGLPEPDDEPYIHHFPDGNASVARLLVRTLIPAAASGSTMDDIVTARVDYQKLDLDGAPVRLRLNSTVVNVAHDGEPKSAQAVHVTYVRDGRAYRVLGRNCVMACYNAMIPFICPDLPGPQREALSLQVKAPVMYTNVVLRNWQAWKKLGIGAFVCPGSYHVNAMIDFPVSMGGYKFSEDAGQPVVVHMERFPHRPNEGLSRREQHRLGRHELLSTSFETIERSVRGQLAGALAGGGFDPARDIAAITVNRWAHGYSYDYDFLQEPYYEDRNDERYPHVRGRKPFGRIAIANSDAAASALLDAAVTQAHRAVAELGS